MKNDIFQSKLSLVAKILSQNLVISGSYFYQCVSNLFAKPGDHPPPHFIGEIEEAQRKLSDLLRVTQGVSDRVEHRT